MCVLDADGTAAMENLRAQLARAKEQARKSDAAAKKALEELRAEQAAHCRSKEEMAEMAEKLKSAADRCKLLEKEDRARQTDLEKAVADAKDARSVMRAAKEELRQAEEIAAGKPFMLRRKSRDPKFAPLDRMMECGGHLSGFGSECRRCGRTLPRSRRSQSGKPLLVTVPQSGASTVISRSFGRMGRAK